MTRAPVLILCLLALAASFLVQSVESFVFPQHALLNNKPSSSSSFHPSTHAGQRRRPPFLWIRTASLDTTTTTENDESMQLKYKSLGLLYGVVAATLFVIPDRTRTVRLASKWGGAAGFGIAAAVSSLLARGRSRFDEATRQRLTVGLYGFSGLGLLAVPGEAAFLNSAGAAMALTGVMNAAKLWGVLVSFKGMGVLDDPQKTLEKLWKGMVSSLKGLRVTPEAKKRSTTYRNCLLLVLTSMVSCLLEGIFYVRYYGTALGRSLFDISLQWSGVARLFLISSILYSLKDLADRQQMTTDASFIQLNLMVGAWALLVGLAQGLSSTGYTHKRGLEMVGFSLIFLTKGLKYTKLRSTSPPRLQPPPTTEEEEEDDNKQDEP